MPDISMQPRNEDTMVFIDTKPKTASPTYARLGEGINSVTPSNSPTVTPMHYINAKNPTSTLTAINKQFAVAGEKYIGDAANEFILSLAEKTGEDVETSLVKVDMWKTAVSGGYPAIKYNIIVAVNNDGTIQGGATQAIDATFYVNGNPMEGYFNPTTKVWTDAEPSE